MTQEEVITAARAKLPLPSDVQPEKIRVSVADYNLVHPAILVTFKKERVNGLVIGWEFCELE